MSEFLKSLIIVSEKAANIARACRYEKELFPLLIQEKSIGEANPRFVQDFKTLADVLIQETVRHDIKLKFPEVADYVKGEESNIFSNTNNETIIVEVKDNCEDTADILVRVLEGNKRAADLLAAEVHQDILFESINCDNKVLPEFDLNLLEIGIWIDPIDSTAEYISGQNGQIIQNNIHGKGLQCVTVLIGVYDRNNGLPLIGVVNSPFKNIINEKWIGHCDWGICMNDIIANSILDAEYPKGIICISNSENDSIKSKLKDAGYRLVETAGAGYKLLTVVKSYAEAYVLSRTSCYKWDTCGPHALLRSCGGGIIDYKNALDSKLNEIVYNVESNTDKKDINIWANKDGIIAFKNKDVLNVLLSILQN